MDELDEHWTMDDHNGERRKDHPGGKPEVAELVDPGHLSHASPQPDHKDQLLLQDFHLCPPNTQAMAIVWKMRNQKIWMPLPGYISRSVNTWRPGWKGNNQAFHIKPDAHGH